MKGDMTSTLVRNPARAPRPRYRGRFTFALLCLVIGLVAGCSHATKHSPPPAPNAPSTAAKVVQVWLTTADGNRKLFHSSPVTMTSHASARGADHTVTVDDSRRYQQFWGVGASLTGASAQLISGLSQAQRLHTLTSLFSRSDGIGLSVLRQPIGPNDFSTGNGTYDDTSAGTADPGLQHFALGPEAMSTLALLRQVRQLNPAATVVASAWSAPAWMKSNGSVIGGTLKGEYYNVYAKYLARAVQAYNAAGVSVAGITVQNEPSFSPAGYAGMTLSVDQQRELIARHVRPALTAAGLGQVGIWALDDNYDRVADAEQLVADSAVRSAIAGVAFHCYHGDVSALQGFHAKHPDVPLAISECSGGDWSPNFRDNLRYDVETLLIHGIGNGASWVSKWNAALDPSGGPANGGCTNCRGVISIDPHNGTVSYNEAYYAFGHLGKFVIPGAQVVSATAAGNTGLETVALRNPDGSHVLLVFNSAAQDGTFRVTDGVSSFAATLQAGSVATYTW